MSSIIEKFDENQEKFAIDAVLEAKKKKGKINDELLSTIENYISNIKEYRDKEIPLSIIYSIYLLAEFKDQRLFPLLIQIYSNEFSGYKWSAMQEFVTDRLPGIIVNVFNGDFNSLNAIIENKEIDLYAKERFLRCYTYFYDNKMISKENLEKYLRKLIKLYDYECGIYDEIMVVIINAHLFDLIDEVKIMFDKEVIDMYIRGGYDSFIDDIFNYDDDLDKINPINDTVEEMSWWYCFNKYNDEKRYEKIEEALEDKIKNDIEEIKNISFDKVGRNDPCPCGSGKKYKKCCLNKQDTRLPYQKYINESLKNYPKRKNRDDILDIYDFYREEYIEIDKILYKILKHKSIPIYIKRDYNKENAIALDDFNEAFQKIKQVVSENNFKNVDEYDKVVSIHYSLYIFADKYGNLLKRLIDKDTVGKKEIYLEKLKELLRFFYENFDLNNEYEYIFLELTAFIFRIEKRIDDGIKYFEDRLNNCIPISKIDVYEQIFDLTLYEYDDVDKLNNYIDKEKDEELKKQLTELKDKYMDIYNIDY